MAVLAFSLVLFLWSLATRRPRLALSAAAGMALIASDIWTLPVASRELDDLAFWRNQAAFDDTVARERNREPDGRPLRLVVEYQDRSIWVASNLFVFIIYDETDRAQVDPSSVQGFWPCPCSNTGVISVDGDKTVRRITGHYYRVIATE